MLVQQLTCYSKRKSAAKDSEAPNLYNSDPVLLGSRRRSPSWLMCSSSCSCCSNINPKPEPQLRFSRVLAAQSELALVQQQISLQQQKAGAVNDEAVAVRGEGDRVWVII